MGANTTNINRDGIAIFIGRAYHLYEYAIVNRTEYISLFDMLVSPDPENAFIACELIKKNLKKLDRFEKFLRNIFIKKQGLLKIGLDKHYTCYYCKVEHKQVEAGGVWYCPNPVCPGPGGHYLRSNLESYKDSDFTHYTIDTAEYLDAVAKKAIEIQDDSIKLAIGSEINKRYLWKK